MLNKITIAFIIIALFSAVSAFEAYGVPAAPFVVELSQPDGTVFSARQWGDENLNGWETVEDRKSVV